MTGCVGVLVMAHGTPPTRADIAPFYTRIRRGRPPTPEQLADLERRYAAIGGLSPLTERTVAQVDGIRAALAARAPGRYVVAYGAKHTKPFIEEAMAETYAQLRVSGINLNSLLKGITFPLNGGYTITVTKAGSEAAGILLGPVNVGGMVWNVWMIQGEN